MNKIRTITITVKQDIFYPSGLIRNDKGNKVRRDRFLQAGTYVTHNYHYYTDRYDTHVATKLELNGFTYIIPRSKIGDTPLNRTIDSPLQHVEMKIN